MPVFTWSPNIVPRNCRPVSRTPDGVQSATDPYVFFKLLVIVPAPTLTQRPRYECPMKPSCPLFECPRMIEFEISPRTLETSPIAHEPTSPPRMFTSRPT